ncbi:MAG: 3-phosphoshikimate 1-carboxyvinyltransferase [Treponema sp.]|jgi:3-phosphoshikimate 1-carboxyvinyltransferase|nr:3-phosphoshikimate 1-carboxyvinyltransferase [Treponema sp.]
MRAIIKPHHFSGTVRIPASKSHTIRRLLIASLADGTSEIEYPLDSLDAKSCVNICRGLGAKITEHRLTDSQCPNPPDTDGKKLVRYTVKGIAWKNSIPPSPLLTSPSTLLPPSLDVGNSGTTLYLALAAAALGSCAIEFTGDEQIQKRSAAPLLDALKGLGVRAESKNKNGCAPVIIQGPWKGGRVTLPCPTSQYLSALLLAAPLAPAGVVTEIDVPLLNERPYIELTLSYLKAQGIPWEAADDFSYFKIPGGASWKPISGKVPGDFSSAAFPGCAAAISGGPVTLLGLDPEDPQGDKVFFEILKKMGCEVTWEKIDKDWVLTVSRSGPMKGGTFDLNATPDMLPALAVTASYAQGDTALVNVAHARIKETDRIAVMAEELAKLGIQATERPDGLIIHGNDAIIQNVLPQNNVRAPEIINGHGDHRIVMAFAAAALGTAALIEIDSAESAAVTYPGFLELLGAEWRD